MTIGVSHEGPRSAGALNFLQPTPACILLLLISVPLVFTWATYNSFEVPKAFIFESLTALLIFFSIRDAMRGKGVWPPPAILFVPFIAFFTWAWLTLPLAGSMLVGVKSLWLWTAGFAFFVLSSRPLRDRRVRDAALWCIIGTGAITSVIAILQYFGLEYTHGIRFDPLGAAPSKYDIYSTIGHPNFLGSYLSSLFPLLMGILTMEKNERPGSRAMTWGALAAAAAVLVCLPILQAKGPWLGLFASLIAFAVMDRRVRIPAAAAAGILIGAGLFLWAVGFRWGGFSQSLSPAFVSNRVRLLMWSIALTMIRRHPVAGLGFGGYGRWYQPYLEEYLRTSPDPSRYYDVIGETKFTHNDILQIATETGMIGVLLFAAALGVFLVFLIKYVAREKPPSAGRTLAVSALCGLLSLVVSSLVEFPLGIPATAMMFWFLLALGSSVIPESVPSEAPPRPRLSGGYRGLAVAAAGILTIWIIIESFRPVEAEIIHKALYAAMMEERYREAVPLAERGLAWDPTNEDLHLILGSASLMTGEYGRGLEAFRAAEGISPDYMVVFDIGLAYFNLKQYPEAETYFIRVRNFNPTVPDAHRALIRLYSLQGKTALSEEARARLRASTGLAK